MNKIFKGVLCLISLLSIASCANNSGEEETRNYEDYLENAIPFNDVYAKEGKYAVYAYGSYCSHCTTIKGDVFDFIDKLKGGYKTTINNLYLLEFHPYSSEIGQTERNSFKVKPTEYDEKTLISEMIEAKPTSLAETYFFGTPALYVIENNQLVDFLIGSVAIPNYLNSL